MVNALVLTVMVELTIALQVGVVLRALLFMKRMRDVTTTGYVPAIDATALQALLDSDIS